MKTIKESVLSSTDTGRLASRKKLVCKLFNKADAANWSKSNDHNTRIDYLGNVLREGDIVVVLLSRGFSRIGCIVDMCLNEKDSMGLKVYDPDDGNIQYIDSDDLIKLENPEQYLR